MRPFVIGLYGKSNSGKTTLINKIIKCLSKDGIKIAAIKITDKSLEIDEKGKDTWNFSSSGVDLAILSSRNETDYIYKKFLNFDQIYRVINKIDKFNLILIEGVNEDKIPKIRLGDIEIRKNTIFTYDGDFENLINNLKKFIRRSE
jgi:molybdopterin-guanine dinucleotide biosynthesis protein B